MRVALAWMTPAFRRPRVPIGLRRFRRQSQAPIDETAPRAGELEGPLPLIAWLRPTLPAVRNEDGRRPQHERECLQAPSVFEQIPESTPVALTLRSPWRRHKHEDYDTPTVAPGI